MIIMIINVVLLSLMLIAGIVMLLSWRSIAKRIVKHFGEIIFTDRYQENIMELVPGLRHMGFQNLMENSLRAEQGDVLHRPLGSSKQWPNLDQITFIPAQTTPFPVSGDEEINMQVTIGPRAKKPMTIDMPLMISGMAYGISLSEQVRLALAQAANRSGTAINSGEGGILPEELDAAGNFILQFSKTKWGKEPESIKRANMIEIKLGQGALMGAGDKIPPQHLTGRARQIMGLKDDEPAIFHDNFYENQTIGDLNKLVDQLRSMSGGVPIGVKIGAGGKIEEDIDHILEMGIDVIALDGGQGASYGAPPIIADDMGIPTLHAIVRAVNHLEKRGMRQHVSLIAAGGLTIPGNFLKVLALGADAVYVASAILFAVSHSQSLKALPFEPPTQVAWNEGKFKDQFNIEEGAISAGNFLASCNEEMKTALRAMGKRSLNELSSQDLVSIDKRIAYHIGIPFTGDLQLQRDKYKKAGIE